MMKHKHAELIKLWADGAQIQMFSNDSWKDCTPLWIEDHQYRIKPTIKDDYQVNSLYICNNIGDVNIEIFIDVDSDFKSLVGDVANPWRNQGYIQIKSIYTTKTENCFWDNLSFFVDADLEAIKQECLAELIEKELSEDGLLEYVKSVMDDMVSKGYLEGESSTEPGVGMASFNVVLNEKF